MAFAVLLVCLASGMYFVQRQTFEASAHIEWPWTEPRNAWQRAFEWIRKNTPPDAVFALDANYPDESGNDRQGFRAGAERSALPDESKDGGVVALFPQLAHTWKADTALTTHMSSMSEDQRASLLRAGVTWVVIPAESGIALECPYSNARVSVCRLQHEGYAAKLNGAR